MNFKWISLILSLLIFTDYVAYITVKLGWLKSISDSWYHLKEKDRWFFTLSLWGFSIFLAIAGDTLLTFLAAAGICFAGAAADGRHVKITETVHVIGATGGIILGILALIFDFHLWVPALILSIFSILVMEQNMRNHTFWIEVVAYYTIWLGILLNLLK